MSSVAAEARADEALQDASPEDMDQAERARMLPDPKGYKILVSLPEIEEKTEAGIYKPHSAIEAEAISTVVAFVIDIGPDAYADEKRFPNGPYCKEGDFVLIRAFSGTRFRIHGREFRLINDDTVEAVVEDPRGIRRA